MPQCKLYHAPRNKMAAARILALLLLLWAVANVTYALVSLYKGCNWEVFTPVIVNVFVGIACSYVLYRGRV
jgi:uncharacterized integral membrane protein